MSKRHSVVLYSYTGREPFTLAYFIGAGHKTRRNISAYSQERLSKVIYHLAQQGKVKLVPFMAPATIGWRANFK